MKVEELIKSYPFWSVLSTEQKKAAQEGSRIVRYEKGEALHRGGEKCNGLMYIISGDIRVYMISEDGREITLYRLQAGDICTLSASCMLDEITFDVMIDAEDASEVLVTNTPVVKRIAEENLEMQNFLYKNTIAAFSEVMWALQQILFMSLDKRLAIFLWDEMIKQGPEIHMTHEQIAKHMGSAREVISRMTKYFEKEGILEGKRGIIKIIDINALKRLANF